MQGISGFVLLLTGTVYFFVLWILQDRERERRREEVAVFLRRTLFAMEAGNFRTIPYLRFYETEDEILKETLADVAEKLQEFRYPEGNLAWQEVCRSKKCCWNLDKEGEFLLFQMGRGLFGDTRQENISFLRKSLEAWEECQKERKKKEEKQRRVWIPVGMLATVMCGILML